MIVKKHNGLIKIVTGIRRGGKSYLLFHLFKNHLLENKVAKDHILELAFDSYENKRYRDPEILYPFLKFQIKDNAVYYILLDEIQLLDEFESVLNGLIRIPNIDIYVTGSNARFLSRDIATEFRGRGDELFMQPLSFAEFVSVYDGNRYDAWNEYILYGGLPPILVLSTPEEKTNFVCNKGSKRYYVQSAFLLPDSEKLQQEERSLLNIDDSFKKILVMKDVPAPCYTEKGIFVIGIYDFLLRADSLDL